MDIFPDDLIARLTFDAQDLVTSYPPQFHHKNKRALYQHVCPPGSRHQGHLTFTRWNALDLPDRFDPSEFHTILEPRQGFYGYETPAGNPLPVEWYVNFAHQDLFCAYGLAVFAQDEIQVAEHPALASLREALVRSDAKPLTVENGIPTPVLITGAERRCAVDTSPDAAAGCPNGLYGAQFARAKAEAILSATTLLDPPTLTNLIAMEAPSYGHGAYKELELIYILTAALTGFAAARHESHELTPEVAVAVHTGFWGCGAYGGNRVLMALLQILAANLSRIDRLVFHIPDTAGAEALETAQLLLEDILKSAGQSVASPRRWLTMFSPATPASRASGKELATSDVVMRIHEQKFQWGVSDGN